MTNAFWLKLFGIDGIEFIRFHDRSFTGNILIPIADCLTTKYYVFKINRRFDRYPLTYFLILQSIELKQTFSCTKVCNGCYLRPFLRPVVL